MHQALARKWRPNSFATLSGQSHVVRALSNALNQGRLHHAYLFTGTRGVGKTTLGRILTKCLNCLSGITAEPCNQCQACEEISNGRFIDLIEVDAASRTRVEDTRELLENVPYAPTYGRFKVYLIDEAHMLSTHSFNALLKTLEEPPPHVKFFLATTDPQKLPITVLSRCLQFHLKCLSPELITERLAYILQQEQVTFEEQALIRLAAAAEGSMRDALSLLDQAIAFSMDKVTEADVKLMLGTIEETYLYEILEALLQQQTEKLLTITKHLAEQAADFTNVLEELLSLLHSTAILQLVPDADLEMWDKNRVATLAKAIIPEDIQLYYQIGLIGRKDLPLAPTPRIGLEMVLLRMVAFRPITPTSIIMPQITPVSTTPIPALSTPKIIAAEASSSPILQENTSEWSNIVMQLKLSGITGIIAGHCALEKLTDDEIVLIIDPAKAILLNKKHHERLTAALTNYFNKQLNLIIKPAQEEIDTPVKQEEKEQLRRKKAAQIALEQDPYVKKIIERFDATILPDSIEVNKGESVV